MGRDNNQAELCGVVAAVLVCLAHLNPTGADILVVKTDNQSVCQWFGWRGGTPGERPLPRSRKPLELVRLALDSARESGVKLVVTWVKGHQGTKTTRGYLNSRVDEMAKSARQRSLWSIWMVEVDSDRKPVRRDHRDQGLAFQQSVERFLCQPLLDPRRSPE